MTLVGNRIARPIRPPERRRAADGLQVNPPATAGAIVYEELRMPRQQFVPERVEALDVPDFTDALAVGRIRRPPEGQRVYVEILPVTAQPELFDFA